MASVTYKINSQFDEAGAKKAQESLNALEKTARGLTNVFKGLVAVFAANQIGKAISDIVSAFETQQKALAELTRSVQNNANLTSKSLQNIIDYTQKLQKQSIYGDEELQKQAAFLAGLNLTEEQIKNILNASVNLASSGMMPLDTAVENLAKTYAGTAGEISVLIPSIRNLTKEQLESGEAVALVTRQFQGMAETAAQTLEGRTKQITNIIGDIKEKIGATFAIAKLEVLERLKPILEGIDEWLSKNLNKIVNFFINLPEIAGIALNAVWSIIKRVFTFDYLYENFKNLADLIFKVFLLLLRSIYATLNAVSNTIWWPLEYGFNIIVFSIQKAFVGLVNLFILGIQKIVDLVNKVLPKDKELKLGFGTLKEPEAPKFEGEAIKNAWKNIGSEFWQGVKNLSNAASTLVNNALSPIIPVINEAMDKISDVLDRKLPDKYQKFLFPETQTINASGTVGPMAPAVEVANIGYGHGFEGETGPVAQVSSMFGSLLQAIGPLIDMFMQLNSIRMILNPLQIVFQAILRTLQPIIDSLLKPLIGIFDIIGQTIGKMLAPLLLQLAPIIKLVSQAFIFIYNYALRPFGNAVIWLIVTIHNMIATVVNGVIRALDKIPFVNIDWRMEKLNYDQLSLQAISETDLNTSGSIAMQQQSTTGASATYTGVRDVTINIYFEHSFVNGDARAIALMLRDEIRYAEKLGY
ncbi:TPA: hypothetical protein ENX78_08625 [Candidatus Poribacteria bacterium]|nr:hypothetical protein [Candidatus Poribacteria bacterium]